jgi:hypothetical protein
LRPLNNINGKNPVLIFTTLLISKEFKKILPLFLLLIMLMFWLISVTLSPLTIFLLLEILPKIHPLPDTFNKEESRLWTLTLTDPEEEMMRSWPEELLLIPDSLIK